MWNTKLNKEEVKGRVKTATLNTQLGRLSNRTKPEME